MTYFVESIRSLNIQPDIILYRYGRNSKQELQERQLLTETEIKECFTDAIKALQKDKYDEFAFNLYQFTSLIYNNIK